MDARLVVGVVLVVSLAGCGGVSDAPVTDAPTEVESTERSTAGTSESVRNGTSANDGTNTTPSAEETPSADETPPANSTRTQNVTNGTLTLHFINVGQSESILAVGPTGETMLVDTGDYRNDGEYVLEYLRAHNVTRIDYLVSSHNDADHIGGLAEVITYYETEADGVGAVYEQGLAASTLTYSDYLDAVEAHNVTVYATTAGAAIPFAGVNVSVYGPPEGYLLTSSRNENSIVLELGYGNTSVLLPGDAGEAEERYLLETYDGRLNATALKVGHHGSRSSTTAPFLDAVSPRVAVISSAFESQYGHPHREVLARLAKHDIPTFWTATHGNVVLVSDGDSLTVKTQREAPTDSLELRSGEPVSPGTLGNVTTRLTVRVAPHATSSSSANTTASGSASMTASGSASATMSRASADSLVTSRRGWTT